MKSSLYTLFIYVRIKYRKRNAYKYVSYWFIMKSEFMKQIRRAEEENKIIRKILFINSEEGKKAIEEYRKMKAEQNQIKNA